MHIGKSYNRDSASISSRLRPEVKLVATKRQVDAVTIHDKRVTMGHTPTDLMVASRFRLTEQMA